MRIERNLFLILSLMALAGLVQAQEFWLRPKKFRVKAGEELKVDFVSGEQFIPQYWDMKSNKVEKVIMFGQGTQKIMTKEVQATAGNNLRTTLAQDGTYLFAVESNETSQEPDPEKFNEFLKTNALEDILSERTQNKSLDQAPVVSARLFAKLLVQAGDTPDDSYKRRAGFRLEIVPNANPYGITTGDYLQCRLFWDGRPAAHAQMKVWSHVGNRIFLQNIYTEDDGTINFPISSKGPWMVSAVKMIHSEKPGADYQSFRASLVFEISDVKAQNSVPRN